MSTGGVRGLDEKFSLPSPSPLLLTYIPLAHCRGKTALGTIISMPVVKKGHFAVLGGSVLHLCVFGHGVLSDPVPPAEPSWAVWPRRVAIGAVSA